MFRRYKKIKEDMPLFSGEDRRRNWYKVQGLRLLPLCFFTLLLFAVACSSIDCPVQNIVATVYVAKKASGANDTITDTLTILTRRADGTDTTLYPTLLNSSVNTTRFQLSVGYTNPEDTLLFIVSDTTGVYRDFVYIKKENAPHFESVDCNIAYFHTIKEVRLGSHHAIDSIIIVKSEVNYDLSTEHFHIYFKAANKRE